MDLVQKYPPEIVHCHLPKTNVHVEPLLTHSVTTEGNPAAKSGESCWVLRALTGAEARKRLSPMTSTVHQQVFFSTHRQQGHFVSVSMGKILCKQYYLAGQCKIPKWLTDPSLDHDWDNPDIAWLLMGVGDVYHIQEAYGFEEDGAIAMRLREHGIQTT